MPSRTGGAAESTATVKAEPSVTMEPRAAQRITYRVEDGFLVVTLCAVVALPLTETLSRSLFGEGIPDSIAWVRHLALWAGFLGAGVAARQRRHLSLAFVSFLGGRLKSVVEFSAAALTSFVCLFLAWASADMVQADRQLEEWLGGILPMWIVEIIIPVTCAVIAVRIILRTGHTSRVRLGALAATLVLGAAVLGWPEGSRPLLLVPGLGAVLVAALAGVPIFALLGGAALLLFYVAGTPIASIPAEAYRIASNPVLPSLPLFTLAGAVLAESQASSRLVRVFKALFGSIPGGSAVATVAVCAFFTTFTGGSGVTILALGGLMLPVLLKQGYKEKFSLGLLTGSGSLGILFPPSLLIILYGVQAQTPIDRLFLAGIAPGLLLVVLVAGYSAWVGRSLVRESRSTVTEILRALWEAKWEAAIPVVVLFSIFSGFATLVEAASLTALYTVVIETLIHRELGLRRDMPRILVECGVMVGGIFIILACAMGLTNYLIDAEIPVRGADWVQSGIASKALFLLALNAFLVVVGCLMDVFSAIVVVVPLILPVADAFGVDRVHLGIIFLANMELGYLTPPVGMNLFVACFRFQRPLMDIYKAAVPFLIILLAGVLLITYVPWLAIGLLQKGTP